jgi:hypothetical protein
MKSYDYTISLNAKQFPVRISEHVEDDKTLYDIMFEDRTITIYKNTLYLWASDNPQELSQEDIQSLGEQIINAEPDSE